MLSNNSSTICVAVCVASGDDVVSNNWRRDAYPVSDIPRSRYVHSHVWLQPIELMRRRSLCREGYAFREDSRYFVLAERHKSKDTLGVYDAHEAYRLVRVRYSSMRARMRGFMT